MSYNTRERSGASEDGLEASECPLAASLAISFPGRPSAVGYRYFFYDKHHGRGGPEASRWLPELSDDDEFAIFDQADLLDLSDEHGNLYGIRVGLEHDREVLPLGTRQQQIAKFPISRQGTPWHGFPLGPLEYRTSGPAPPVRDLPGEPLSKMVNHGLLTGAQRRRLLKGKLI
jgi:hypothetical protein